MQEGVSPAVEKKPRIIVADVLVRLKKRRRAPQEELDYDEEVAFLSQLANGIVADPRDSRQADEVTDESRDYFQDDYHLVILLTSLVIDSLDLASRFRSCWRSYSKKMMEARAREVL